MSSQNAKPGWKDIPLGGVSWKPSEELKTGAWRGEVKPVVDNEKCKECLFCWIFCPDAAILWDGEVIRLPFQQQHQVQVRHAHTSRDDIPHRTVGTYEDFIKPPTLVGFLVRSLPCSTLQVEVRGYNEIPSAARAHDNSERYENKDILK